MNKEELIKKLEFMLIDHQYNKGHNCPEYAHGAADDLLIQYINDKDIQKAYDAIPKWYD